MDVGSTHDWYVDLGELVGQLNVIVVGVRGRRGEGMDILVIWLEEVSLGQCWSNNDGLVS